MPAYSSGNNEEYLVHIIAILHLVEQKGTAAKVKEAFAALVAVRMELNPLFKFPNDKTATKKETRKKKINNLKENPQGQERHCYCGGPEGLQAVPLLHCWQGANAMGQNCEWDAHKEPMDWREWQV
jgi:hypothetical protein